MRLKLQLSFFLFFSISNCFAQIDTTFWLAAPNVSSAFNYDRPIYMRVTSYQSPATVTISEPANPAFPLQTFTLPPYTSQSVNLTTWIDIIECTPGDVIQNRGVKITSTNKVAAYYEVNAGGPNPEFFALKGRNSLGSEFYISSQYILGNSPVLTPAPISSFNIVATEDNTNVTITPAKNIVGHTANIPFTINLNKGQTYAAIAVSALATGHLQGSYVTSTKPVAITVADDLLQGIAFGGACEDLAGDQIVPVNVLGQEYIAIRGGLNSPFDKIYVMATQSGTVVKQDGVTITTLAAGQSTELSMPNSTAYVQTSQPAYVYQLTGVGCEVGSALLPKITCTGSSSVSVVRSSSETLYITLLVKNGAQGNFLLNNATGIITAAQFNVVPSTGGQWYYARITLSLSSYPVGTVIKIDNTAGLFQMGFMQGGVQGAGFGYFSDYNAPIAEASASNIYPCAGTNVNLYAENVSSATYSWEGPGGYTSGAQNPVLNNITAAQSGNYIVSVNVPGCGIYKDTVTLNVVSPAINTISQTICEGTSYLGYTVTGVYTDHFTSAAGCDSARILNLTVKPKSISTVNASICQGQAYAGHTTTGIYTDTYVAANGCDSIRTLNLTVKPRSFTTNTQSICEGSSYEGHTVSGTYVTTLVAANGCDSIYTLNLTVRPKSFSTVNASICEGQTYAGHTTAGTYIDTYTAANGCDSIRTLNLTVHPVVFTTLNISICQGQTYQGHSTTGTYTDIFSTPYGCDSTRTLHLTVKSKSFSTVNKEICFGQTYAGHGVSGTYIDTYVAANGCDSIRTLNLIVNDLIQTTIIKTICEGDIYEGYTATGIYNDVFTAASGCDSTRTLNLTVNKLPLPYLGKDTAICFEKGIIINPGIFDSYLWQDGSTGMSYTVSQAGLYSVTVTNSCGTAADEILITDKSCQAYFPNVFTPNGDHKNDFFKILNPGGITEYHLLIFNRWGEKVFETTELNKGWDGNYKRSAADEATYVWIADFKKNNIPVKVSGSLMLLR